MANLKLNFSARTVATLSSTGILSTPTNRYAPTVSFALANGTGIGLGDQAYGTEMTLAAGSAQVFDLYGVLPDGLGGTINIARLKFLQVASLNAGSDNAGLLVGAPNAVSEYFELDAAYGGALPHEEAVDAGGLLIRANPTGWTIQNGVNDWLWVKNNGAVAATFSIFFAGASA